MLNIRKYLTNSQNQSISVMQRFRTQLYKYNVYIDNGCTLTIFSSHDYVIRIHLCMYENKYNYVHMCISNMHIAYYDIAGVIYEICIMYIG